MFASALLLLVRRLLNFVCIRAHILFFCFIVLIFCNRCFNCLSPSHKFLHLCTHEILDLLVLAILVEY